MRRLLDEASVLPLEPGWALEQAVKKLYCQLTSRYTNQEDHTEQSRHRRIVSALVDALGPDTSAHVALALTGSLAESAEGVWHPYFSDIDVMPLFATRQASDLVSRVRLAYDVPTRPTWVHLNEGARKGVAGLTHDPVHGLFVADRLHTLDETEFGKLGRLVAPMRHIGGSEQVFDTFARAHRHQVLIRTHDRGAPE